jgi:hypothetical protein
MSYDDRQAASILKKAAELQSASAGGEGETQLSIDDLKRIGAEVGIAPEMVEEASRRMGNSGSRGGRVSTERVITVDGELGERDYEEVVAILRSEYGHPGTPSTLGSAYEWSAGETGGMHLSMMPRGGKTTITVSQRRDGIVVAWILSGIFSFMGILLPLIKMGKQGEILLGALYAVCITLFLMGSTLLFTRAAAEHSDRKLDEVMDRIADTVATVPSSASLAASSVQVDEIPNLNQQA